MTIDERFQQTSLQLNLLTLKTGELDKGLNQLTANLNELTLKVDLTHSYLKDLTLQHSQLAATVNTVLDMQGNTLALVRELTAIVGNHEGRLRHLES